jgi:hypothetical protein
MSDFNPVSIRSLLVVMVHLNANKINSMQQGICILAIKSSPWDHCFQHWKNNQVRGFCCPWPPERSDDKGTCLQ